MIGLLHMNSPFNNNNNNKKKVMKQVLSLFIKQRDYEDRPICI